MYFIDTNILIYVFDNSDIYKTKISRKLVFELLNTNQGCISTQVVQEFCNVSLTKASNKMSPSQLREILDEVLIPLVGFSPDEKFYYKVIELFDRYSLNFYDATIIQAAIETKCKILYSEDMQNGASYGSVKIVNPFIHQIK